ncbi:MAG: hypothetical protein P9L92_01050 [Candidatus Electryonea clarkiae]|nr:hypothetical protein [Candidatus Electryonea clarkiae]MDP8287731.1 hypothetical protein [Candidatus Electryonea clarkiae]
MKHLNILSAVIAGIAGTILMTLMMMVAPMMGMPKMNVAGMLSGFMHVPLIMGWIAHFMIGTILGVGFAVAFANRGKLPGWLKGMLYGLIPWLMAQIVVMPMMGAPLFSGSLVMAMGSLMGHLLYGGVVGAVYRPLATASPSTAKIPSRLIPER